MYVSPIILAWISLIFKWFKIINELGLIKKYLDIKNYKFLKYQNS